MPVAENQIWLTFEIPAAGYVPIPGDFLEGPDIEAAVAEWLRNSSITGVGTRVYTEVPATPTFPLVTVTRIGGVPAVREYLDMGAIQVDCWGGTKAEAHDAAVEARVACLGLEGQSLSLPVSIVVTSVEDALGLTWQPDEDTGRERYLFAVNVYARPL